MSQYSSAKCKLPNDRELYHCNLCSDISFKSPNGLVRHLRQCHCSKEGGSFVCLYGTNNVCPSLPLEGVSDKDYEEHVTKHHAATVMSVKGTFSTGARQRESSDSSEKWGVYSSTQNIPAVLNDPKKGMKRDFFTKIWGETFVEIKEISPHIALPEITPQHFETYMRRLKRRKKELKYFANAKALKNETLLESDNLNPANASHLSEKIPSIFLTSLFNLKDPSTFYSVFSHITSSGISRKNARPLQDQLIHILELVEHDMIRQIAKKSSAFFDTMMYLNAQMDQLQLNHKAVFNLRNGISTLKKEMVTEPTKILALPRKRAGVVAAIQKLEAMSAVKEVQATIQVMLARQEYTSALDLIDTTQELLQTELCSIKALRHLSSELTEHGKLIDKMVSLEFIKYITEDLNRPLTDTRPVLEEDQLIAVVFGVLRLQKFDFLDSLKNEVNTAINATVKQAVAEMVSEVEMDQETTSVADQARALPIPLWLSLLQTVTSRLKIVIARVKVMVNIMIQAVNAGAGRTALCSIEGVHAASITTMASGVERQPMVGETACTKAVSGLREILCSSCDFSHDRCAKLLHARSRDQALDKMSVNDFLSLSRIIEGFVEDTEMVCGRKSTAFRMGLQGQATRFVAKFHEEREGRLKLNLTSERWKAVAIPADLQILIDHIMDADTLEFPPVVKETVGDEKLTAEPSGEDRVSRRQQRLVVTNGNQERSRSSSSTTGGVVVCGEEYVVVGVCVVVIRLIVEYAENAASLRITSHQLLNRLMDLLRKFNADTCRLLVEAGAVSFGLKTITTRHLALAWRSLQLLLLVIPKLDRHFSKLLKPSLVEKHVEKLIKEYEEHCKAIELKIVKIMGDILSKPLSEWEAKSPVPSQAFNSILKSLSRLHETISTVLTATQVKIIFDQVTSELKDKLRIHLKRLSVSPLGPQSWVVMSELTFYFNHITSLGIVLRESQEDFIGTLWPLKPSS